MVKKKIKQLRGYTSISVLRETKRDLAYSLGIYEKQGLSWEIFLRYIAKTQEPLLAELYALWHTNRKSLYEQIGVAVNGELLTVNKTDRQHA